MDFVQSQQKGDPSHNLMANSLPFYFSSCIPSHLECELVFIKWTGNGFINFFLECYTDIYFFKKSRNTVNTFFFFSKSSIQRAENSSPSFQSWWNWWGKRGCQGFWGGFYRQWPSASPSLQATILPGLSSPKQHIGCWGETVDMEIYMLQHFLLGHPCPLGRE